MYIGVSLVILSKFVFFYLIWKKDASEKNPMEKVQNRPTLLYKS